MSKDKNLGQIINFNTDFKSSINLYLSLNKTEKINSYIPTKSSITLLKEFLQSIKTNKEHSALFVGPYGKGKSHLLLVLLAILSLDRMDKNNDAIIKKLVTKIDKVEGKNSEISLLINDVWKNNGRYLPVLIQDTNSDLQQDFIYALNEALRRAGVSELTPDTAYDYAKARIEEWKKDYPANYKEFANRIKDSGYSEKQFVGGLSNYSRKELDIFIDLYPLITAGSVFNPLVSSDALCLYESVSDKLKEDYGYSGIYIVFDEFSKFIEGQSDAYIGKNMKLLQNMCELASESKNSKIFITMVAHKSIKEYGNYLSPEIINLFTGIEGRIIEKYFITSTKNNYELIRDAIIKDEDVLCSIEQLKKYFSSENCESYFNLPCFRSVFNKKDFEDIVYKGCFPMNPISSYLLLNVSEKVAQNERTLFTFISNDEPNSMARYVSEHDGKSAWLVGADLVYDYFSGLFKKEVMNEYVHSEWLNAEYALSKCENEYQAKVIKALAVILIVNKEDELPAIDEVLFKSIDIPDYVETMKELENKTLIYRRGIDNSYAFKTRAGSALKKEIKNRRAIKGNDASFDKIFDSIIQRQYYIPRKYNGIYKMTRFFYNKTMDVETFMNVENSGIIFSDTPFCDGIVITLYTLDSIKENDVRKKLRSLDDCRIIVVCPQKKYSKVKQVIDYEIIQELKNDGFLVDNQVMMKELPIMEEELEREIENELRLVYSDDCKLLYRFPGDKNLKQSPYKECEDIVGRLCESIYYKTPIINNEIINRQSITTGPTKKTRGIIVNTILNNMDTDEFYSGSNQEATIARALLKNTRINDDSSDNYINEILGCIENFLNECTDNKNRMDNLIDVVTSQPYGMRKGTIPIYLAYVMSKHNEDIVVYFNDMEVQLNDEILINMCESPQDYQLFISKEDVEKEKYISELNKLFDVDNSLNLTENRIKNIVVCMQRKFRALPQVTKNLPYLDEYDVVNDETKKYMEIYKKLIQRLSPNPYEFLFSELPEELEKAGDLGETYNVISEVITAFDDYIDWIIRKAYTATKEIFSKKRSDDLVYLLKRWYDNQSTVSKQKLLDRRATNFMGYIGSLDVFSDEEVVCGLIKAVTDVYIENWNIGSFEEYISELELCKRIVETIDDGETIGKYKLTYDDFNGENKTLYYEKVNEGAANILRNILEDTLDEYSDLSINDRVSVLVEIIDKIVRK